MKILIITIITISCVIFIGLDYMQTPNKTGFSDLKQPELQAAPLFNFTDLDNKTYQLQDFKGKRVLLNFWATWCAPCIEEFPILLDIAQKNKDDLVLIALSVDNENMDFDAFFARFDSHFQRKLSFENVIIGTDPQKNISKKLFNINQYPETILMNETLEIKKKYIGLEILKSPLRY